MRRVVVTGGNKGIGLAVTRAVLGEAEDSFVYLGSRDAARGAAARRKLTQEQSEWASRVEVLPLDVTSHRSVQEASQRILRHAGEPTPLYGLVNNAGVSGAGGLKTALEVNLVGMRRVSEALLPLLTLDQGRVVNITSASGPSFVSRCSAERQQFFTNRALEWPALEALMVECLAMEGDEDAYSSRGLGNGEAYGLSKACANSYTQLLARENPALLVNACTPGFIETDMTRGYAESQGKTPAELGMNAPDAGARTPLFLLFGDVDGTGRFYGSDAQRSPLNRYRAPGSPPYTGE